MGARKLARPIVPLIQGTDRAIHAIRNFFWSLRLARLGRGTRVSRLARIYRPSQVRIGSNVVLNDFIHIWGGGGVTIGDDTIIASHVVITSQSHDTGALSRGANYRDTSVMQPVVIGSNVWIGAAAVILPGVEIGDNSVIAAGSIVSRDIPPSALAMGSPARVARHLP